MGKPANVINYDDGNNYTGIGTNGTADFDIAARYTPTDLTKFDNQQLTHIGFVPMVVPATCTYSLRVWKGGAASGSTYTSGRLIIDQQLTTVTAGQWNLVPLTTPVTVDADSELWIGVRCNTTGGYPAGADNGPAIAGKGDLLHLSGSWVSMYASNNMNYNWNLQGFTNGGRQVAPTAFATIGDRVPVVSGTLAAVQATPSRMLNGYKIYRDNEVIATVPRCDSLSYNDINLHLGNYAYQISSTFVGVESPRSVAANMSIEAPTTPVFSCSPASKAFGSILVNTLSAKQVFKIRNLGDGELAVETPISITGTNAGEFTLSDGNEYPIVLTPGDSAMVEVQFSPSTVGDKIAYLTIEDNMEAVNKIQVTGTGFDPVIHTLPYTENFDGVSAPALPANWVAVDGNSDGYEWVTNSTYANSTPNSVYMRYDSYYDMNDWLFSPPIDMVAGSTYKVKFQYSSSPSYEENLEVKWGSNQTVAGMTLGQIFDAPGFMSEAYLEGSALMTPATTGSYIIGWHGYSDADKWYISIDDISVELVPPIPSFTVAPTSADFGATQINTISLATSFVIQNAAAGTMTINAGDISITGTNAADFALTDTNTYPVSLTAGQSMTVSVAFAPTTVGAKSATLAIQDNIVRTLHELALTGTAADYTITSFPYVKTFEDSVLAGDGWRVVDQTGTSSSSWRINSTDTFVHAGTKSAQVGYDNGEYWLITPPIQVGSQGNALTFWARDHSASTSWDYEDEYLDILVSTTGNNPADFTTLLDTLNYAALNITYADYYYDLSAYAGQKIYVAFRRVATGGNYVYLDDIQFGATPSLDAPVISIISGGTTGVQLTWGAVTGANMYKVYSGTTQDNVSTLLGRTSATSYDVPVTDTKSFFRVSSTVGRVAAPITKSTLRRATQNVLHPAK